MLDGLIWIFINLVMPVAAPLCGMWLERISASNIRDSSVRLAQLRAKRFVVLFKDGQLGWINVVMCFAAISEVIEGERKHGLPGIIAVALLFLLVLVLVNGHFATRGASENSEPVEDFSWANLVADYPIIFHTAICTACTAVLFAFLHFWAQ